MLVAYTVAIDLVRQLRPIVEQIKMHDAHGEAREMLGCLDCALAWGYAPDDGVARATLDRLLALCWGLTH